MPPTQTLPRVSLCLGQLSVKEGILMPPTLTIQTPYTLLYMQFYLNIKKKIVSILAKFKQQLNHTVSALC